MFNLRAFRNSESGASLVEYAVALIVVTIIGGVFVLFLGQASGQLARNADAVVGAACSQAAAAASGTTGVSATGC